MFVCVCASGVYCLQKINNVYKATTKQESSDQEKWPDAGMNVATAQQQHRESKLIMYAN